MNFTGLEGYRKAAEQACRLYLWEREREISLLQLSENATFLLKVLTDGRPRQVMRVSRIGYHSVKEIEAELQWLLRLQSGNRVKAVCPLPNGQGRFLTVTKAEGQEYVCVVFSYLEGYHPDAADTVRARRDFYEIGRIAALLHEDIAEWSGAGTLDRPRWDWEHMVGRQGLLGDWRQCRDLTRQQYDLLDETCCRIRRRLISYGEREDNFGLIHSDLRAANLLKKDGVMQVLDFDDCGFGWHLYDLAGTFSFLEDNIRLEQWVRAWLEGYETVLPLRKEDIREIPTMIMARRIQLLAWITSHEDSDPVREMYAGFAGKTAELAERYQRFCRFDRKGEEEDV